MNDNAPSAKEAKQERKTRKKAENQEKARKVLERIELERLASIERAANHAGLPLHQLIIGKAQAYIGKGKAPRITFSTTGVCPVLDRYLSRKSITDWQHWAGLRLAEDWLLAGLSGFKSLVMEQKDVQGQILPADARLDAQVRYFSALKAVGGLTRKPLGPILLVRVCCHGDTLEDIPLAELLYYRRGFDAMPRFKEALDDLLAYYDCMDSNKSLDDPGSNADNQAR